MLLSGIYYGKTPIVRAYKSGEIIWNKGVDHYFSLQYLDFQLNTAAYITKAALGQIEFEYRIRTDNQVMIQCTSFSEEFVIIGGYCLVPVSNITDGNSYRILFSDKIQSGNEAEEYSAPITQNTINHNVADRPNVNIEIRLPSNLDTKNDLQTSFDTVVRTSQTENTTSRAELILRNKACTETSNAIHPDANEVIIIGTYTNHTPAKSAIENINETVEIIALTYSHTPASCKAVIDTSLTAKAEDTLQRSVSQNGIIKTVSIVNENAPLAVLLSKHCNVDNAILIHAYAKEQTPSSVTYAADDTIDINTFTNMFMPQIIQGGAKNDTLIDIGALTNVSASAHGNIDEIVLIDKHALTEQIPTVQDSIEVPIMVSSEAPAHISESAVVNTDSTNLAQENDTYILVPAVVKTVSDKVITIKSMVNKSVSDIIQISTFDDDPVSLDCDTNITNGDLYLLTIDNMDIRTSSDSELRRGEISKISLQNVVLLSQKDDIEIVPPTDIQTAGQLHSIVDSNMTLRLPSPMFVDDVIKASHNITIVDKDSCDTRVDQNLNLQPINELISNASQSVALQVDAQCEHAGKISKIVTNCVGLEVQCKKNTYAYLSFWAFPIKRNTNLSIRQVHEIDDADLSSGNLKLN